MGTSSNLTSSQRWEGKLSLGLLIINNHGSTEQALYCMWALDKSRPSSA